MSESLSAREILLAISRTAARLFRNNTGLAWTGEVTNRWNDRKDGHDWLTIKNPRPLRAGLCVGSSDYIGWDSVVVTPDMVGRKIAVFLALETKDPDELAYLQRHYESLRTYEGKDEKKSRLRSQINFIETVKAAGGFAGFASTPEEALRIIQND